MLGEYKIAVDLGGTFIKFGRFGKNNTIQEKWEVETPKNKNENELIKFIVDEINRNLQRNSITLKQLKGVGIGVPGSVNQDGIVIHAPNIGWKMTDVKKIWRSFLSIPVLVGNDANLAALGECYYGSGKGYDSMVFITLGTGVGGSVILNGNVVPGVHGAAGELGHMPVNTEESEVCGCGKRGCLEQYASANGVVRMAHKLLEQKDNSSVLSNSEGITAKDVFNAVKNGDMLAKTVAEEFGKAMGQALACVASTIDPEIFVIGGGMSKAGEILLTYIDKYYQEYTFTPSRTAKLALASLGNEAGIFGAMRLIQENGIG